jgi:8-oxo-dGTP pyrophosphatase MutT (NUDIX family)
MPISDYFLAIRAKVGNACILAPGASALIFNDDGKILLQRRSDNGLWQLIGGATDPGEDPVDTVIREVQEETGLAVLPRRLVGVYSGAENLVTYDNGDQVAYTITAFECQIISGQARVNDEESLEVGFFALDALPASLPDKHRKRIQHWLQGSPPYFHLPADPPTAPQLSYVQRMRAAIRSDMLLSPGATALIFDQQGQLLIQRRRDNGMWNLIGGLQEIGEEPAGTAMREALEESGLIVRPERLVGVYGGAEYTGVYPNGDQVSYTNFAFRCAIVGGELRIADDESAELRFVAPDALPEPFTQRHRRLIEHALYHSETWFNSPSE